MMKNPLEPGRTDEGAKCFIHRVRYIGWVNGIGHLFLVQTDEVNIDCNFAEIRN